MRHAVCRRVLALLVGLPLLHGTVAADTPLEPANRPYQAQWIWGHVENPKPFQFVRFRKTIELAVKPASATAYVTADTFYRLWINGQLVMHGPARSGHGKATVDPIDVGHYLVQGQNTLTVEAFHGVCPFETLAQSPGLLCELEADIDGKPKIIAATDATWEAAEITAWNRDSLRFSYQRGWIEQFDARRTATEKWQPAIVLGKVGTAPWRKVEIRDIPLPSPLLPVRPANVLAIQRGDGFVGKVDPDAHFEPPQPEWDRCSEWFRRLETEHLHNDTSAAANPDGMTAQGNGDTILQGDGTSIAYDLGLGYVGFLGFEVTGHDGQVLEIVWNERLSNDGAVRPRAQTGNNVIRYALREGRQSFLAYMPQFVRFLRVVQRGAGPVTLHRLGLTEFRFVAETKGDFQCSDEQLNRIYQAAKRTAMLCTLDAYMDCPHRERNAMYGLEASSLLGAVYPMFGDTSVSRRAVQSVADGVNDPHRIGPPGMVQLTYPMHLPYFNRVIPAAQLYWIVHAGQYERYSGDRELLRTMIPVMRANLEAISVWRNAEGLLATEKIPSVWMFFDYADIRTDGISIALSAFDAKAMDEAARLERLVGDSAHADRFAKQAHRIRDVVNRLCTNPTFYPDAIVRDDKQQWVPSREASETTQYYAMWGGLPSPERFRRMWQAMRDDFVPTPRKRVQPIQGLARAGLYPFFARMEAASQLGDHPALVRDIKAMFLPMIESAPGTLWEDPMGNIALCHAIGCGVGGVLTEEVLGIRLGFPLRITPHNAGVLEWCKGHITTPKGRVEVAWKWRRDRYELQVSIPKGLTAEVVLPPEACAVWQSGRATAPWQASLNISAPATVLVQPGRQEVK